MSLWAVEVVIECVLDGLKWRFGIVPFVSGFGSLRGRTSVWVGEVAHEEIIHNVQLIPSRVIFRAREFYVPGIEDRRSLNLDARGLRVMGSCGTRITRGGVEVAGLRCVRNTTTRALHGATEISKDVAVWAVELTYCIFAEAAGWEMIDFNTQLAWAAGVAIGTGSFGCSAWRRSIAQEAPSWILRERIEGGDTGVWHARERLRWIILVCCSVWCCFTTEEATV